MNPAFEDKLISVEGQFDALHRHEKSPLEDDRLAGRSLKFYLLLTTAPELLAGVGLSPEQIFWSRYYWFSRYIKVRQAISGHDAGLEQQLFKILETPLCSPDWDMLEEVEKLASRDAAAQLAR